MLTVKEAKISSKVGAELRHSGIFCYKTADRFRHGIPDLYVCGGSWIEHKVVAMPGATNWRGGVDLLRWFTGPQKNMLNLLSAQNDKCFAGVYFMAKTKRDVSWYLLMPWEYFKLVRGWDAEIVQELAFPMLRGSGMRTEMVFDKSHLRNIRSEWWICKWGDFQTKFPLKVMDNDPTGLAPDLKMYMHGGVAHHLGELSTELGDDTFDPE